MDDFSEEVVTDWQRFISIRQTYGLGWIFRGQSQDWPLESSLERAFRVADIPLNKAVGIEKQLIRDFRRRYDGDDCNLVMDDTLYCLALMQHYGAPTRLLDWSYSPFVAAFFALESANSECIVWCINGAWCLDKLRQLVPDIDTLSVDEKRKKDSSFVKLFVDTQSKFVSPENPFRFHERLITQQGVFLCPGDVSSEFLVNLQTLEGWHDEKNIVKLRLRLSTQTRQAALEDLFAMNISNATLFPGLDGFAKSLKLRLPFYAQLANKNTGEAIPNN